MYRGYMMPVLLVLVVIIAGLFSELRSIHDEAGQTRTGMRGFPLLPYPHFEGLTVGRFFQILLDAMSQLFFSPQRLDGYYDHLRLLCASRR